MDLEKIAQWQFELDNSNVSGLAVIALTEVTKQEIATEGKPAFYQAKFKDSWTTVNSVRVKIGAKAAGRRRLNEAKPG